MLEKEGGSEILDVKYGAFWGIFRLHIYNVNDCIPDTFKSILMEIGKQIAASCMGNISVDCTHIS